MTPASAVASLQSRNFREHDPSYLTRDGAVNLSAGIWSQAPAAAIDLTAAETGPEHAALAGLRLHRIAAALAREFAIATIARA